MRLLLLLALAGATDSAVAADDGDRALGGFASPASPASSASQQPAAARGRPPDALEWERRLRGADRLGPRPLPAQDMLLVDAARAGDDKRVRALLAGGAPIDRRAEDGFTALGAAAFAGRRSTVRLLLRAGADPATRGAGGQTALHLAAVAGQTEVLDDMLRRGVDIEVLNGSRESALDVAAAAGQDAVLALLLAAGAAAQRAGRR